MVKCERCGKKVNRRVTYNHRGSRWKGKKVCRECEEKISYEEYSSLCNAITQRDGKKNEQQ